MTLKAIGIILLVVAVMYDFFVSGGSKRDDLICGILALAGMGCIFYQL
jgi:hypothetical protein